MNVIRHVVVHGQVQGVGFRVWTEFTAARLGLEGWARNRRDGSVEAVFAGPETAVERMIEACRRGPPAAEVDAVDTREGSDADLASRRPGESFSLLPTV
jgi:acylphosphatase